MDILKTDFIRDFIKTTDDGYKQGWHERNGGNLSYRMKESDVEAVREHFTGDRPWMDIGTRVPDLAGEYFVITGTGKYFRNVVLHPEANIGIIEINAAGDKYKVRWGLKDGGRPTSELPTHLMNHEVKKKAANGAHRVIYHCHPANIIALTFVLPLSDKVFTRELWEMMPECPVVFPEGIGVVEWMVPGSREIAVVSSDLMKKYNAVIWAHHGLFCSGEDFDTAFGLAHTIEKAAEILVKVLSIRPDKLQTITSENLRELSKAFRLDLPEEFLYDK